MTANRPDTRKQVEPQEVIALYWRLIARIEIGSRSRARTDDSPLVRRVLYHLSYPTILGSPEGVESSKIGGLLGS